MRECCQLSDVSGLLLMENWEGQVSEMKPTPRGSKAFGGLMEFDVFPLLAPFWIIFTVG